MPRSFEGNIQITSNYSCPKKSNKDIFGQMSPQKYIFPMQSSQEDSGRCALSEQREELYCLEDEALP